MTLVIMSALGVGLSVGGLVLALRSVAPSAAAVLYSVDRVGVRRCGEGPNVSRLSPGQRLVRPDRFLGESLAEVVEERGWLPGELLVLLEVTETPLQAFCSRVVIGAVAGLVAPFVFSAMALLLGVGVPALVPAWTSIALGVIGGAMPFLTLKSEAKRKRRIARTVIGSFLDLVVLCLAGGMGIESALHAAARIADDEFSIRLVATLELARDTGDTPWQAMAVLGHELGVSELSELAAAVGLAGTEGARIRATLAAKAASIRRHELADAESEANTLTERLFLPGVLLLVGFLVFVGYPAVARIAGGF
ncbi:MAG: type II secretion system F family protein [Acidimicrobiales bacterium]